MTKHEIDQTPLAKCERERDEARIALARFESSSPELGDLSFREQLRSQLIRDGLNAMEERDEARAALEQAKKVIALDSELEKANQEIANSLFELRGWVKEAIANLEFGFDDCALATLRQAEGNK